MPGVGRVYCHECHIQRKEQVEFGLLDLEGMRRHLREWHQDAPSVQLDFPGDGSQGAFRWGND